MSFPIGVETLNNRLFDITTLPYVSPSGVAGSFVQKAYDLGWVLMQFDWSTWKQRREAVTLRNKPRALAQATPEQLARLLTVCIRQDRFVEGALEWAFQSRLLTRILERAAVILNEIEQKHAESRVGIDR